MNNKEIKLFENDYTIQGKHATHLKFLVNDAKIFSTYIEVYLNAVIFGYMYNAKDVKDTISSDRARIYADAFANKRKECMFLYRLITLLEDDNEGVSVDERLNRAFRYDTQNDKYDQVKENIDTFNAYVLGGIEIMFKRFVDGCSSQDDYIRRTFEIVSKYYDDIQEVSYEDKINKLIGR